ncbi:MAG: ferritin family protein [Candidatus Xenobiia bacterium LiM19]
MSVFKDFSDVLEVAVRVERLGIELYKKLYDTVESPHAKSTFSFLAAEEEKHAGTFRKLLEENASYTPRFEYPGEYGRFLNDYAASIVGKVEKAGSLMAKITINEALEMGIEFEKESILFYYELKSEGDFDKNTETLQKIIDEERSHWRKLISLKDTLKF